MICTSRRRLVGGLLSLAACGPRAAVVEPGSQAAVDIDAHRARQRTFPHDGATMAYVDEGQGLPVLLVHGVPTSSWMYRHVIDRLVVAGFRVVAPDLLGWGSSLDGVDPERTGPAVQAQAVLALAGHLGLRSWTHICHDVGGPVSFELLGVAPDAVQSLVVLDTFAFVDGWDPPIRMTKKDSMAAEALVAGFGDRRRGRRWTEILLRAGLANRSRTRDDALVEGYARPLREGANQTLLQFMTSLARYEAQLPRWRRILRDLDRPACVVWGRRDTVLDWREQVPRLQALLSVPDDRINVVPDAGHFIAEERPDVIEAAVKELASL